MANFALPIALCVFSSWTSVLLASDSSDDPFVPVRHAESLVHGFLVLRTLEGKTIADGDLIQTADGDRVTSKLIFRFRDGSSRSETAVFSQSRHFRLLTDHLVEKGPTFKLPAVTDIDASTGQVSVRYTDKDGKEKVEAVQLELPGNLANGIIFNLLKNIDPSAAQTKLSMIASIPKPRLVQLTVTPQGEDSFWVAGSRRRATHFVVKVEIGGIAGLVAPLVGKKPPDTHVWILDGEAPAFVKFEGPLYFSGPIWRIELASPVWPESNRNALRDRR